VREMEGGTFWRPPPYIKFGTASGR
jgi:hypothetical protein